MNDTLRHYEAQWRIEHDKSVRLEQENLALLTKIELLEEKLSSQAAGTLDLEERIYRLNTKLEHCYTQLEAPEKLEALQKSLLTPGGWTDEFIVPFVEELGAFSFLSELQYSRNASSPSDWCQKLLKSINGLAESFRAKDVREAKKVVIALWVYLQWLEIIHGDS